jgi:hypothetical protein
MIINQLRRRTRNRLDSIIELSSDQANNLSLKAEQDGSISAVSVAGTFMRTAGEGDKKVKFADDNLSAQTSNSLDYWSKQATGLGLAGAGSINVQQLVNVAENRISNQAASLSNIQGAAYRIKASAADRTALQNWSGAFGYGSGGATQPAKDSAAAKAQKRNEESGQWTIAGAATVNQVARQVTNSLQNIDFGANPFSYNADASTDGAQATAGAQQLVEIFQREGRTSDSLALVGHAFAFGAVWYIAMILVGQYQAAGTPLM